MCRKKTNMILKKRQSCLVEECIKNIPAPKRSYNNFGISEMCFENNWHVSNKIKQMPCTSFVVLQTFEDLFRI